MLIVLSQNIMIELVMVKLGDDIVDHFIVVKYLFII